MAKTFTEPGIGEITIRRTRRAKRITLRASLSRGISLTIPWFKTYGSGLEFVRSSKDWILETLRKQKEQQENFPPPSAARTEQMRALAKEILPARLKELAEEHSFHYNQVRIKNNVSNWGSCSRKGNINLNLNLVRLPEELRDYVLLHELCHMRHPNHGVEFHALLESLCPEHRNKEKELRKYRIF